MLPEVMSPTWRDRKWRQSRDRKWHHNRKWRHHRAFFYYCSSTKCTFGPHPSKGTFCTTTIVRKKRGGKWRHFRLWRHFRSPHFWWGHFHWPFPVTSLPVAHLCQTMMDYGSFKQSSTDQTPKMPPPPPPPPPP